MNYTQLCKALQDTVESPFTDDQLAVFFRAAEEKAYNVAQPPALRKNVIGSITAGSPYVSVPVDFYYPFSVAVVTPSGAYEYLMQKDVSFIREAYPTPDVTGTPKHYALFSAESMLVGPTADATYDVELHYAAYPASITVAGTSWLGDKFESVLLNLALVEAARFMKAETDTIAVYEKLATESLALFKNLGDGKLRQDVYRSGQTRTPVN